MKFIRISVTATNSTFQFRERILTTCPNITCTHNILFPLTGRESRNEICTTRDSQDSQMVRVPGRKSRRMPCIPLVEYREILPRKWTASGTLCWKIIVHTDVSIHAWKCISKRGSVPAAVCDTFLHFQAPRTSRVLATHTSCPRVFSPSSLSLSWIRFETARTSISIRFIQDRLAKLKSIRPSIFGNSLELERINVRRINILATQTLWKFAITTD